MNETLDRRTFDRRLFLIAAVVFPLLIVAGFGRTYYLKGLFDTPPLPTRIVHLHGLLMTAWVALFVSQVWLISSRRVRVHQRMGYAGVGLSILMIPVGLVTALRAAKYGSASFPPGITPAAFLIIPVVDLIMFAILFGAAVYYRKRPAQHKALMLLTALNFLPPALARLPIVQLQSLGPLWFFGFPTVVALVCLVLETRRHGRLNTAFLVGTLLLVGSYVARLAVMGTEGWLRTSAWLTSFV